MTNADESAQTPAEASPGGASSARHPEGFRDSLRIWRSDAAAWLRLRGFELWLLVGLWAVVSLVIFWLSTGHESPRRYQDEFLYWGVAKAFAAGDGLTWRGVDIGVFYPLYPVLLAPAFWLGDSVAERYTLIHLINSLMMVGVVFPAYFFARMFMDRRRAFLAALFAIAVPAMNYAGIIGTESLGYPAAAAAFGAIVLAVAIPRPRNWLLALAAIFIAVLTRTQFVVFMPIYLGALVIAGLMRGPGQRKQYFRAQLPVLATTAALLLIAVVVLLVRGKDAVGLYKGVFEGVSPTDVWYWIKAFTADVFILAGIIPVIATLAMGFDRENRRDPLVGALLATALVGSVAFIAEITYFSAINEFSWRDRNIFYERYMFYLGPLFFTGLLVAWRRVSFGSALIASLIGCVILSGFPRDAVLVPFSYDSFGLTLVGWFMNEYSSGAAGLNEEASVMRHIGTYIAAAGVLMSVIYVASTLPFRRVARYAGFAAVLVAFGVLFAGQAQTWYYARLFSHDAFRGYPKPADFIDKAIDKPVGMIVTSNDAPEVYFAAEFWNQRVVRAFATDTEPIKTPIMYSPRCEFDWDRTGLILGTGCDIVPSAYYMRSPSVSMHLRDEYLRVHPTPAQVDITLMAGREPARLFSIVWNRNVFNGTVQGAMSAETFLKRPGEMRLTIAATKRTTRITIGGRTTTIAPRRTARVTGSIPASDTKTVIEAKSLAGIPQTIQVDDVEVREPGGRWTSIK